MIRESQKCWTIRRHTARIDRLLHFSGKETHSQGSGVALLSPHHEWGTGLWLESCILSQRLLLSLDASHFLHDVNREECLELAATMFSSLWQVWKKWGSLREWDIGAFWTPTVESCQWRPAPFWEYPSVSPFQPSNLYTKLTLLFSGQELTGEHWYFCPFVLALKFRPCRGHSEFERILEWNMRAGEHFPRWICI